MNPILVFLVVLFLQYLLGNGAKRVKDRQQRAKTQDQTIQASKGQKRSHQVHGEQDDFAKRKADLQRQLGQQVAKLSAGKSSNAMNQGLESLSQKLLELEQGFQTQAGDQAASQQGNRGAQGQVFEQKKNQGKQALGLRKTGPGGQERLEAGILRNSRPEFSQGPGDDAGQALSVGFSDSHQALLDYSHYLKRNPVTIEKISLFDQEALDIVRDLSPGQIQAMRLVEVLIWSERIQKILSRYNNLGSDFQAASQAFVRRVTQAQEVVSSDQSSALTTGNHQSSDLKDRKGRGHKWRKAIVYQTLLQRKLP